MLLGIDGGGSKTAYRLTDSRGQVILSQTGEGISWREGGVDAVLHRLGVALEQLLQGRDQSRLSVCIGVPCYGENPEYDAAITTGIARMLPRSRRLLVNDAVLSWAGALGCAPGVSLVAGTGSLAYGRNAAGQEARSGGWSEHFSDEGSAYWIALRGLNLYTRQADGRLPRGPLTGLFHQTLHVDGPVDFVCAVEAAYLPSRKKTASLQRVVLEAACQGDESAIRLYGEAAEELAAMAGSAARALQLPQGYAVSCTGGLLHAGALLLNPLRQAIRKAGGQYHDARFTPVEGAVLLAEKFQDD